jgi:hypothetical protein
MANPLHELSDLIHRLGDDVKSLAERFEHAFAKDEAPVAAEAKADAEKVVTEAVKAAETDAAQVVESN